MSHLVDREVSTRGGGMAGGPPVKGKVVSDEALGQGPRRVWGPKGGERGERGVQACRRRVDLRGGADNPQRRQALALGHQEGNRGEAGF